MLEAVRNWGEALIRLGIFKKTRDSQDKGAFLIRWGCMRDSYRKGTPDLVRVCRAGPPVPTGLTDRDLGGFGGAPRGLRGVDRARQSSCRMLSGADRADGP